MLSVVSVSLIIIFVKDFSHDCSLSREIKSRIAMAKAAFDRNKKQIGLKFREETSEVLHLELSTV
jgi:hypothetical protein